MNEKPWENEPETTPVREENLLDPFLDESEAERRTKLRELLASRLERRKNADEDDEGKAEDRSARDVSRPVHDAPRRERDASAAEPASKTSARASSPDGAKAPLDGDDTSTPASPLQRFKEKADSVLSPDQDFEDERELRARAQNRADELAAGHTPSEKKKSLPQAVAKRRFVVVPTHASPKKKSPKRLLTLCFLTVLLLTVLAFIFAALEQMHREDEKAYLQKFMNLSESRPGSEKRMILDEIVRDNCLIRLRKPEYDDDYLNQIISMYTQNQIKAFLYEQADSPPLPAKSRPCLAIDYQTAERRGRLLSIAFKMDRWDYTLAEKKAKAEQKADRLFDAGYGQADRDAALARTAELQYKSRYLMLYYDLHLRRLLSPSELMDMNGMDGALREFHLNFNDGLPAEDRIPEVSPLRSQKNMPLLLFRDDSVEELLSWRNARLLDDENGQKRRVPLDSYDESRAAAEASPGKVQKIPYTQLNPLLHMELVFEAKDMIKNENAHRNEARIEDEKIEAAREGLTPEDLAKKKAEEQIENKKTGETEEEPFSLGEENADRDQKALLFMPEQNSPYWVKGQALFTTPPDPFLNKAAGSAMDFKYVAFTFDDGPYTKLTPSVIKLFREHKGFATFYILGITLDGAEDTLDKILENGNEIGNHSYYHDPMTTLNKEQLQETLGLVDEQVRKNTKCKYRPRSIRPPYGDIDEKTASYDNRPFVLWDVDSGDWANQDNMDATIGAILNNTVAGSVILMHDSHDTSVQALENSLSALAKQGFRFVTVSELFKIYHKDFSGGKIYRCAHD